MASEKQTLANDLKSEMLGILEKLDKRSSANDFSANDIVTFEHELINLRSYINDFGDRFGKNDPDFVTMESKANKLSAIVKNNPVVNFI